MPERLLAPAAMATLLCLTTAVSAETPDRLNAEQGWSSIKRCAQEDTERARHTCLDRVLQEAGLLTDEMHAQQQRRAFGLEDKPVRAPTPPAPLPARTAASVAPSPAAASSAAEAAPAPAPAAVAVAPAASPPAKTAPPAPPAPSDRLEVELVKVDRAANGRLFVTTTDGAVWLQNETVDMPQPPMAGDRMTIRKSSLGGYRCSVASTHLTYRCARNR